MRYVVVLVGLVLVAGGCSDSGEVSTTTVPLEPITSSSAAASENANVPIDVALAGIDAWNSHDFAAFRSAFTGDGTYHGFPVGDPDIEDEFSFWTGLGDDVSVLECMVVEAGNPLGLDAGGVACLIKGVDQLSGTVGKSYEGNVGMNIVDGLISSYEWFGFETSKINYTTEMVAWVRENRAHTFTEVFADPTCNPGRLNCWGDWMTSAAGADALLDLHPEYREWLEAGSEQATGVRAAPDPDLPDPSYEITVSRIEDPSTNSVWVYQPVGDGPWPLVYAIPGSGGDARDDLDVVATELARRGVLVFATDWITDDADRTVSDVECGYRLARSVASDFGGDLSLPVLMYGSSQGATSALDHTLGEPAYGPDGSYTGCPEGTARPDGAVAIAGCHDYWGFGSDTTMWGNTSATFTLAGGTDDTQCSLTQTVSAAESLSEAGYDVSAFAIENGTHGGMTFHDPANPDELLPADHIPGQQVIQLILDTIEVISAH